ncbi:hypothetical protein PMAYCL1PPCAC_20620, partial [Pristionchus mayeri]
QELCLGRIIGSTVLPSIVVAHIGITTQQALIMFGVNPLKRKVVSRVILALSIVYAIVYGIWTYLHEPLDGVEAYCGTITEHSEWRVVTHIYILFMLDIATVIASLVVRSLTKKKLMSGRLSVDEKFDHSVNVHVIVNTICAEALHAIVYFYLFVVYAIGAILDQHSEWDHYFQNVLTNV